MNRTVAILLLASFALLGVVTAAETCSSEYCVCVGACPDSYSDDFSSLASISNGESVICYAANNGITFGIGGDDITININIDSSDSDSVGFGDLASCPETPPVAPPKSIAAFNEGVASSAAASSVVVSATIAIGTVVGYGIL